jgi:photosynthetic reaction center H subunit
MSGTIVGSIDLAAILFTLFWVFFVGLIFYLRREDKREGYPLESDRAGGIAVQGFPGIPAPKTFRLANGGTVTAPRGIGDRRAVAAEPAAPHPGAPLVPTGDPMRDGVGPASYAARSDTPDLTIDGEPRVVPLRTDARFSVSRKDADPRGMTVIAADGEVVGHITDTWIDRAEPQIFYLEVGLSPETGRASVLLPMAFAEIDKRARRIRVKALYAHQFNHVPELKNPDQITLLEEDRISAYYAGGLFYADARRQEPLL